MLRAGHQWQALHQNGNECSQDRLAGRGIGGFPGDSLAGGHGRGGARRLHDSIRDRAYLQQLGERDEGRAR